MRYVPFDRLPSDEWLEKSKDLLEELKKLSDYDSRIELINCNRDHWNDVKKILMEISHDKCWYTESKNDASYMEVEHFRPKGKSKDGDHDGYWWLAFEWENYRLAASMPNRKKGSYFPLRDGSSRVCHCDECIDSEENCLLDPIKPEDCNLITFNEIGEVIPSNDNAYDIHRVTLSKERYGLNDGVLSRNRRIYWENCKREIYRLQKYLSLNRTQETKNKISSILVEIKKMIHASSEYSSVSMACIKKYCGQEEEHLILYS